MEEFFSSPSNRLFSNDTRLRESPQIFTLEQQRQFLSLFQEEFKTTSDFYKATGIKIAPEVFDEFLLGMIFKILKASEIHDESAKSLGQWAFGSPDFMKLSLILQLDLAMENPGINEKSWEKSRNQLKDQILSLKNCQSFSQEFKNIWRNWNIYDIKMPNLDFALKQLEIERSLFALSELLFEFLWSVESEDSLFSEDIKEIAFLAFIFIVKF